VDEEALAVAAAEHRKRGGGGAEDGHILDARRGSADEAGRFRRFAEVL
jgi:hypothetical protein